MNLMDMIKGAVAQQAMDKLGGSLGMDSKKASSVFETASAAILGGIMKKASSGSEGAKSIFDMAKNTDTSVLDKLGDVLGGSGAAAEGFQKAGGGILDMVMGGSKAGIITAISKALGIDNSMIGKLLTMVAPIVMGMLSKQVKSQGLDANGLTNFLSSQQSSISKFLPGSLTSDLGLSGLAAGASKAVAGAANEAGGGLMKLLLPLVVIGALAFGAWKLFLSKGSEVANTAKNTVNSATSAVTSGVSELTDKLPSLDSMDFSALGEAGTSLKDGFGEISKGLTGLAAPGADETGAKGLLETINTFNGKLDGLGLGKMEGVAKTAASSIIGTFLQSIQGLLDKVPEPLKAIVQPAITSLVEKLSAYK